jgi:hypothetical protein
MVDEVLNEINEGYAQAPEDLTDDEKFVQFHIGIEQLVGTYEEPTFMATAMFCRLYMKMHEKGSR